MAGRLGFKGLGGDVQGDVDTVLSGRAFGVGTPIAVAAGVSTPAAPDAASGDYIIITPSDTTAFVIANPINPPTGADSSILTLEIANASGGVQGATTFGTAYRIGAAFTVAANGKGRLITFQWNGLKWVEVSRSAADIN